jgi:hypothetical protein
MIINSGNQHNGIRRLWKGRHAIRRICDILARTCLNLRVVNKKDFSSFDKVFPDSIGIQ